MLDAVVSFRVNEPPNEIPVDLSFRLAPNDWLSRCSESALESVRTTNEPGYNARRLEAAAGSHDSAAAKLDRGGGSCCGNPDCGDVVTTAAGEGEAVNLRRDSPGEGVATQTPLAIPFPNSILQPKS